MYQCHATRPEHLLFSWAPQGSSFKRKEVESPISTSSPMQLVDLGGGGGVGLTNLPIGPSVDPVYGLYLEYYKVIPKMNYLGAYGYLLDH